MLTNFKRILGFAISDFARNKGISVAAIFVLTVTILLISGLFFFQGMAGYLISQIRDKIDITAYFKVEAPEEDILNARSQILNAAPAVTRVDYVSREQALEFFNERHKNNPVLSRALEEVGDNPFLPSLNITTNGDPAQYEEISNILQTSNFGALIDKVDFSEKRSMIEKVYSITTNINFFGIIFSAIFAVVAILVVFNTVRLGIENSKDEIATMKIVGASGWFVRGPFIVQGIIYGIISFLICFLLSGLSAYLLSAKIFLILPGFDLFSFFLTNWWIFILLQLGFGAGVGAVSALIVVKKHLDS